METCPFQKNKVTPELAELLSTPTSQVDLAFQPHRETPKVRGGFIREGITPRLTEFAADDHTIQASFTEKELTYIGTASKALSFLAVGKILNTDKKVPSVKDNIVSKFDQLYEDVKSMNSDLNQDQNAIFLRSILSSELELLTQFAENFPNLLPALFQLSNIAGIAGLKSALYRCETFLNDAISGEIDNMAREHTTPKKFAQLHTIYDPALNIQEKRSYEVHCASPTLGRIIVLQAAEAAKEIVTTHQLQSSIFPESSEILSINLVVSTLQSHLDELGTSQ